LEKRSFGGVWACALPVVPATAAATVTAAATISRRDASGSAAADMLELNEDVMFTGSFVVG
jgi:hypothetical protein